jgi:hypothetical protein
VSTARWQSRGARRGEGRAAPASATGGVARGFTPSSASASSAHKHGHAHWRALARARATGAACRTRHSSYLGVAVLKSPCSLMQGVGTWSDSHFSQGADSHFAQGTAQNKMLLCVVQDQDHLNQAQGRAWSWSGELGSRPSSELPVGQLSTVEVHHCYGVCSARAHMHPRARACAIIHKHARSRTHTSTHVTRTHAHTCTRTHASMHTHSSYTLHAYLYA